MEVLIVEDSPADIRLAQEVLASGEFSINLHVVRDGVEAMGFLRHQGKYTHVPKPDLILLDLNMPRMDGREVMAKVKNDRELRRIPIIVLTMSHAEGDVLKCYDLHANCYVVKPMDMDDTVSAIQTIERFWLSAVTLPPH